MPVVLAWTIVAAVLAVELPTLEEAQTGALTQTVATDSRAVEAERLSAELFAFPLASRTLIVQRDPGGLPAERLALTARRLAQANGRGALPVPRAPLGAYGITNAIPGLAFAREAGTHGPDRTPLRTRAQPGGARGRRDGVRADARAPAG